ncbi:hypothetical protein GCM10028807_12060 [Spirosoma daeguense]
MVITSPVVQAQKSAQSVALKPVSSLVIADQVLHKGLATIDLGLYPGSLLMHAMSELSVLQKDPKNLKQALELFEQFRSKKIDGRGSFVSYEVGGSGVAYLYWLKKSATFRDQVMTGADKLYTTQKRSSDGILTATWAKDSLDQVFIDVAFAVTPYLLYSGLALNKPEYVDKAVFETLELFRILHDPNGLIHQGRGFQGKGVVSQDNWSRGNGWGAFALATLVRDLPDSHPQKKEVNRLAKAFFQTVLTYQNQDGLWHQEMTDTTSFVETSGSGLLLYGIGIALEKKLLNPSDLAAFRKGLSGYLAYITEEGSVGNTCIGCLCPGKGTKVDYTRKTVSFNDHHAFGPVVLAFTQAAKLGVNQVVPRQPMGSYAETTRPRTFLRYMPEANGNILWENDRIAFRVYGPPVKDRVSSGIDIWTKSVSYPIIDKWYQLAGKGQQYHIDRGEGCDFFHVGFGRGNGGTAIWFNNKPYISQTYSHHRVLKSTDDEISFELLFDPWVIDGFNVAERKIISMKLGTNLFKVVSTFETDYQGPLTAAIGISFANKPEVLANQQAGTLTLWESYLPQNGELGTAVIASPGIVQGFANYQKDQFMLINVKAGQPVTYYVGAGWTKNPQIKSKQQWLDYINQELRRLTF